VSERQITDDDRRILNEALDWEVQFSYLDRNIRRLQRELEVLQKIRTVVADGRAKVVAELNKRDLNAAWDDFVVGGLR
jgi:hypothetical protein